MTKLIFKVHSEGRYAKSRFPRKLRPHDDELLSSWLIRLALRHGTAPMTFTNLYMPETKNKLWSSDLDLQADTELITRLAEKSGAPLEDLHRMTLGSYAGYLFEAAYCTTGGTPFVNPLGMRGRRNTLPGVRDCPLCLREDKEPYFRKHWRLALSVVCLVHGCYLHDRCPKCGIALTPYLAGKKGDMTVCHKCGWDISDAKAVPADREILEAVGQLYETIDSGYLMIDGKAVYSHLYFQVVHQLLKLMMSRMYGPKLCDGVGLSRDIAKSEGYKAFEWVPVHRQAEMLWKALWLLDNWPERFIEVCSDKGVLSSGLLRDMCAMPFWYWRVVNEHLYRPDRFVTEVEIREAIKFMEDRGMTYSERALSRLLGVGQVFRKRGSQRIFAQRSIS